MSPLGKNFIDVRLQDLISMDRFVKQIKASKEMQNSHPQSLGQTFGASIQARLETIKNSGIKGLKTRQDDLVKLIADIVNHETENGHLTDNNEWPTGQLYWRTLLCYLQDVGFKLLGSGYFSAAFEHELLPQRVIKVGFKVEDSGATYAAWCRQNQHLYGIPKIHDLQRHDSCYTVVLDKLIEYDSCEKQEWHDDLYTFAENILMDRPYIDRPWDDKAEALKVTMQEMRKFFLGMASFDLHSGNVMIDPKTNDLIITDPVSFTSYNMKKVKPSNGFMVDLEEIIESIEKANLEKAISKARRRHERKQPEYIQARKDKRKELKRKQGLANDKAIILLVDDGKGLGNSVQGCNINCRRVRCVNCPVKIVSSKWSYSESERIDINMGDIRKLYMNIQKARKREIRLDLPEHLC